MSLRDILLSLYVYIDDFCKRRLEFAKWRTSNNDQLFFTDAEVLTIALMQPVFALDTLAQIVRLIEQEYTDCLPALKRGWKAIMKDRNWGAW